MEIKNVKFNTFSSGGSGIVLKFEVDDSSAKQLELEDLINLKKKVGTLKFEIDDMATEQEANKITQAQQAKLHVLYKTYSDHTGHTPEEAKANLFREFFVSKRMIVPEVVETKNWNKK